MKFMIIGHGKDTVCELMKEMFGMSFTSSSWFACELFIYSLLKDSHGYNTIEECFNDRVNHRETWHTLIKEFNTIDRAKLARLIFEENDIYCGLRDRDEFLDAKAEGLFDYAIWVDASKRLPPESAASCTVTKADSDYILRNNGPESELRANLQNLMLHISFVHSPPKL